MYNVLKGFARKQDTSEQPPGPQLNSAPNSQGARSDELLENGQAVDSPLESNEDQPPKLVASGRGHTHQTNGQSRYRVLAGEEGTRREGESLDQSGVTEERISSVDSAGVPKLQDRGGVQDGAGAGDDLRLSAESAVCPLNFIL